MLRSVAPIAIHCSARALPFAHQEKAAICAATVLLTCVMERKITLKADILRFDEINTFLVCPSAVASLTIPFDSCNGRGRIRITASPDATDISIFPNEKVSNFAKYVESNAPQRSF
jgi:hypothetical protein